MKVDIPVGYEGSIEDVADGMRIGGVARSQDGDLVGTEEALKVTFVIVFIVFEVGVVPFDGFFVFEVISAPQVITEDGRGGERAMARFMNLIEEGRFTAELMSHYFKFKTIITNMSSQR